MPQSALVRLILHKMALIIIPPGSGKNAFGQAMNTIAGGGMATAYREAKAWTAAAILAVRQAAEPNPCKTKSDEEIAAEIMRGVDARKPPRPWDNLPGK